MTLTDASDEEIAALKQVLLPAIHEFEGNCYESQRALRDGLRRRWLAYDVWCHKPELLTKQCLALVDDLLPSLTEKTTACLAVCLVAGNVGGFGWAIWSAL